MNCKIIAQVKGEEITQEYGHTVSPLQAKQEFRLLYPTATRLVVVGVAGISGEDKKARAVRREQEAEARAERIEEEAREKDKRLEQEARERAYYFR